MPLVASDLMNSPVTPRSRSVTAAKRTEQPDPFLKIIKGVAHRSATHPGLPGEGASLGDVNI